MSIEQAKKNLALEIRPTDTLTSLAGRAQDKWDDKLDAVEVEGATPDQSRTLYSNLYRLSLYPNSAHENVGTAASPKWKHTVQSSTDSPPATETRDQRGHRRRQGLRQQRLLGHVPDRVGGLRDVRPRAGRRADRRLRPAVPRRRLDRALVLAGLREPDDRHELGRRVRRRLRQGGQGLRRPRRLRRGGPERHRGAAGRRPERPERRPQGPGDVAVPRLHAVGGVGGRLVGARGLHQRLRHRQHGEGAGRPRHAEPTSGG